MEEIRLPDLEVIRRFSIAVRSEHAPVEEVVEALRTDLDRIEQALRGRKRGGSARKAKPAARRATGRRPARRAARPARRRRRS